jgi:mannose-6-phosphate isomerase
MRNTEIPRAKTGEGESRSVRRVAKPWGHELIFAENERYAGKILHLEGGHCLSLQYHERKDETLYVLMGEVALSVEVDGQMREIRLVAGEAYRVRPGVRHRLYAENPCDLVEVSSPELEDVVRLEDAYGRAGTIGP